MILAFTVGILITCAMNLFNQPDLTELRQLYLTAAVQRDSTSKLSALLLTVDKQSSPVLICYKGVAQMMEAKYTFGPLGKYQRFNAGKELIEYAMALDSANMEIRYLRFTIQKSIPSFLGYNSNEATDKNFLVNNFYTIGDKQLRDMVSGFLTSSGNCSATELTKIKN